MNRESELVRPKPYSPSCDRNAEPIFDVLKQYVTPGCHLFEVGSGTGQHACLLAERLEKITWICSDLVENHDGIRRWIAGIDCVVGPLEYCAGKDPFPIGVYDIVFTANSLHIMPWEACLFLFQDLSSILESGNLFIVYGPFKYNGQFTSESNERFNGWLKEHDPRSGIKDFENVRDELKRMGFQLSEDHEMPANNRMLVFKKD